MGTWSTSKPRTQRNSIKMEDVWQLLEWKDGEYHQIRMLGPISSFEQHWIEFRIPDGRKINLPKMCLDYDPKTEALTDGKRRCPYCKAGLKSSRSYIGNCIDRDAQSQRPKSPRAPEGAERKAIDFLGESWRLKDPKSKSWTPVRVIVAANTMAEKLGSLSKINKHTIKGKVKTFDVSHPRYGIDVNVRCEKKAGKNGGPPNYDAGKEEKTQLSDDEKQYLLHDLRLYKPETVLEAQASWDDLKTKLVVKDEEGEEDEDDLGGAKAKKSKGKAGKKLPVDDEDEDEDEDDDDDLGDIEDFDEVIGGKKKSSKTKPATGKTKSSKSSGSNKSAKTGEVSSSVKSKSSSRDSGAKKKRR